MAYTLSSSLLFCHIPDTIATNFYLDLFADILTITRHIPSSEYFNLSFPKIPVGEKKSISHLLVISARVWLVLANLLPPDPDHGLKRRVSTEEAPKHMTTLAAEHCHGVWDDARCPFLRNVQHQRARYQDLKTAREHGVGG